MTLRDLSQWFDEHLDYPLPSKKHPDGRTYTVPSPDPKTGAWLAAQADLGQQAAVARLTMEEAARDDKAPDPEVMRRLKAAQDTLVSLKLDDDDEKTFYQRVLGDAYGEMVDDGVPWLLIQRAGQDAYLCFAMSQAAADDALQQALGKAAAAPQPQPTTEPGPSRGTRTTPTTRRATGGSKSSRASTRTRAQTRKTNSKTPAGSGSSSTPTAPNATKTGPVAVFV